jgi:hypothetical protein
MPYINDDRKAAWAPLITMLKSIQRVNEPMPAGELNYLITELLKHYVSTHTFNYETLNAAVGAVESAKAEFQRRVVGPYEDTKIKQNGDVYDA